MTQANARDHGPVVPVRPQPNVYTVLMIIAIIALCVAIAYVAWRMTSPMPDGYGLSFEHLYQPKTPLPD